ncbi:Gfo/Idh/MocA family oxidoreductase [Ruania alkalisoli]|uniref:Gfo/Idh/MocA family oxidoreductase n=1 Tax=Ruania alkalisoli TaxID=2779775 RepID=A0A7M1SXN6_9MICO|nr:Gfo/Idh/MocA family oxidoreductase [Ruania alkalisoli]QOR71393.1 Gfo/Idh/MocA family oxidoreductase [Ruania alkalisoli]
MDAQTRWGFLGPGRIAEKVAADFEHVRGGALVAVGSRSGERAEAFAARHAERSGHAVRAHAGYDALLSDPEVDAVYIATPHTDHASQAIAAIEAGKAVLVEKSFTATLDGARRVVESARHHQVFAMEAMWTRFQPAVRAAKSLITDGAIGEVRAVQADLGVRREFDPDDRMFSLELGGGTLLDLGVYVVSFAQHILGTPDRVVATGSRLETGVDGEAGILLGYDDGRSATLHTSFHMPLPGQARIYGTHGWIDIPPRFHHPVSLVLHRQGEDPLREQLPPSGAGYAEEFIEVGRCLAERRTESDVMPLADTLAVQAVLEEAADQLGVRFTER